MRTPHPRTPHSRTPYLRTSVLPYPALPYPVLPYPVPPYYRTPYHRTTVPLPHSVIPLFLVCLLIQNKLMNLKGTLTLILICFVASTGICQFRNVMLDQ